MQEICDIKPVKRVHRKTNSAKQCVHVRLCRSQWQAYGEKKCLGPLTLISCSKRRKLPEFTWSHLFFSFLSINCLVHYPSSCVTSRLVVSFVSVGSACWFRPQKGRNMPSTFSIIFGLVWCGVERGEWVQLQLFVRIHAKILSDNRKHITAVHYVVFFYLQIFVFSSDFCFLNVE